MNIRDFKKAEPLLKKYEALCKEIGLLKVNAHKLADKTGTFTLQLPLASEKYQEQQDNCYPEELQYLSSIERSLFILHSPLGRHQYGRNPINTDKPQDIKTVEVSETLLLRIYALLISDRVDERKRVVEDLKQMGFHYKIEESK